MAMPEKRRRTASARMVETCIAIELATICSGEQGHPACSLMPEIGAKHEDEGKHLVDCPACPCLASPSARDGNSPGNSQATEAESIHWRPRRHQTGPNA